MNFNSKIFNSKINAKKGLALLALSWINLHTLYSLHSLWFLWTIIIIGNPCYLSNWRMWYNRMNGTMLFLANYLWFLFKNKKKHNGLSPQFTNSYQGQSQNFMIKPSYAVWLCFEFCQILWPLIRNLSYYHDQSTYTSTHMLYFWTGR